MTPGRRRGGALLYGANGYTGRLVAAVARREGLPLTLGGRRPEAVAAMARETGQPWVAFRLDHPERVAEELAAFDAVLLAAGPFSRTSAAVVEACLATGTHYLDITGEVPVFEAVFARDDEARRASVTLLPGTGFDVVPSDCLAAALASELPGASRLLLAFRAFAPSSGTARTMLEGLPKGGAARVDGKLVPVPPAWKVREIPFSDHSRHAMTVPWGDLSTAWRSTGIPNIETYMTAPPALVASAKAGQALAPLLSLALVRWFLEAAVGKAFPGPDEEARERERSYLWGRVERDDGAAVEGTAETLEGYAFTAESAVACLKRVLSGETPPGALTPSLAFGPRFVEEIRGTTFRVPSAPRG